MWVLWTTLEQLGCVRKVHVQFSRQDHTFLLHWMEVLGKTCFPVDVVFHYLRAVICIQISYQLSLDPSWEFEVDKEHLLVNTSALF